MYCPFLPDTFFLINAVTGSLVIAEVPTVVDNLSCSLRVVSFLNNALTGDVQKTCSCLLTSVHRCSDGGHTCTSENLPLSAFDPPLVSSSLRCSAPLGSAMLCYAMLCYAMLCYAAQPRK